MKYKNIPAAIHNFGHSFLSLMNYVDETYVVDDLNDIILKGHDIEIDWMNNTFYPPQLLNTRLNKSIELYCSNLKAHMESQNVGLEHIREIKLYYPSRGRKYMWAIDDCGQEYKIHVSEIK